MRPLPVRAVVVTLAILTLGLVGCMPGPNPLKGTPVSDGGTAGFWLGLWHGVLGPVTFVMSLFKEEVGFYEVHNNGGWYNAGFLLGLGMVLGGGFQGNVQFRRGTSEPATPPPPEEATRAAASDAPSDEEKAKEAADDEQLPPRGPRSGPAN